GEVAGEEDDDEDRDRTDRQGGVLRPGGPAVQDAAVRRRRVLRGGLRRVLRGRLGVVRRRLLVLRSRLPGLAGVRGGGAHRTFLSWSSAVRMPSLASGALWRVDAPAGNRDDAPRRRGYPRDAPVY